MMKTFSMKLLSVTTKSRDPVLVPDASLFCDARKMIPSLFPSLLFFSTKLRFLWGPEVCKTVSKDGWVWILDFLKIQNSLAFFFFNSCSNSEC